MFTIMVWWNMILDAFQTPNEPDSIHGFNDPEGETLMAVKVGINGFGRMAATFAGALGNPEIDFVAVND